MREYTVVYDRDETGAIIAYVPSVPGCHTYGRSIRQARHRIREALEACGHRIDKLELSDDTSRLVPPAIRRQIEEAQRIEQQASRLPELRRQIAGALIELNLSSRDVAFLVGLSHQRVHQVTTRHRRADRNDT